MKSYKKVVGSAVLAMSFPVLVLNVVHLHTLRRPSQAKPTVWFLHTSFQPPTITIGSYSLICSPCYHCKNEVHKFPQNWRCLGHQGQSWLLGWAVRGEGETSCFHGGGVGSEHPVGSGLLEYLAFRVSFY